MTPAMPWHERASVAKACPDLAPSILGMLIIEAENAGEPEYAAEFQSALDGEWSDLEWLFNRDALAEQLADDCYSYEVRTGKEWDSSPELVDMADRLKAVPVQVAA